MLMLGYASSSKGVLLPISDSDTISICDCNSRPMFTEIEIAVKPVEHMWYVSAKKLMNVLVQPCVVFLPTEQLITPIAIN